jgi:hypothetical protein
VDVVAPRAAQRRAMQFLATGNDRVGVALGDPRINIQNEKGKAKAYQIRQVLLAIDKMEHDRFYER